MSVTWNMNNSNPKPQCMTLSLFQATSVRVRKIMSLIRLIRQGSNSDSAKFLSHHNLNFQSTPYCNNTLAKLALASKILQHANFQAIISPKWAEPPINNPISSHRQSTVVELVLKAAKSWAVILVVVLEATSTHICTIVLKKSIHLWHKWWMRI